MTKKTDKKCKPLVSGSQYQGKYVAFSSSGKKTIIASNSSLDILIREAQNQGEDVPSIVFVPKKGSSFLY